MADANSLPRTKGDLEQMIAGLVQESVHLDYKRSDALVHKPSRREVSKDVSSFLNSDGGMIVYGVEEIDHLPTRIDDGVPNSAFTREQLEQIILSNIAPRPDGVEIVQIELSSLSSAYAIRIPKGYKPYQDAQQSRYFKRFNFQSVPMEHYEIEDVRARHFAIEGLVNVDLSVRHGFLLYVVVSNPGKRPAENVRFQIEPMLQWRGGEIPRLFQRGTQFLAPGREFHFLYDSFHEILGADKDKVNEFAVRVRYRHPLVETDVEESFHFDLQDFMNSAVLEGDMVEIGKKLETVLKDIAGGVKQMDRTLGKIARVASPTGLNLSQTALRNLLKLQSGHADFSDDSSRYVTVETIQEILEVDFNVAYRVYGVLCGHDSSALGSIEGITPVHLEQLRRHFGAKDDA